MNRLHKSRKNKMIFGVCGGIAETFHIDPSIIRLLWLFLVFVYGTGIAAYLIVALVLPYDDSHR